ncbi:MAG TPA: FUSC family protein, partial [Solirubrobacteraceae bacterium]|nr:FUSC family protein [Solirubrobacteraceae bacterium]
MRLGALRAAAMPIAQAAVAATIAWVLARHLIGHPRPFFAPISSVVALSLTGGRRWRRAVELVAGVSIGIFVGDVLVHEIG